jgi:hypothetical protein
MREIMALRERVGGVGRSGETEKRYSTRLHDETSRKTLIFIVTTVKASNLIRMLKIKY